MLTSNWALSVIDSVYGNLSQSLSYFWPSTTWPHENILLIELARYAHENGGIIYPECSIKTTSGNIRRDAILVLPRQNAVIQCELKHMYNCEAALRDVERVSNEDDLDQFLAAGGASKELLGFSRYGLFMGYGQICNTCGTWWRSGESQEQRQYAEERLEHNEQRFLDQVAEIYSRQNATVGLRCDEDKFSSRGKAFWLAYFFQAVAPHGSGNRPAI